MNKFSKIFIASILSAIISTTVNAKPAYIPSQLEQFEKTNICINCDLSEANFRYTSHNDANLSQTLLVKASFVDSHFNSANFNGAQLMYASLDYIQASGSHFNSANLIGANLSNANLSSGDFTGAILDQADLSDADLARAVISNDQLASAKSLSCTIMPDGTRHPADPGKHC